MNHGRFDSERKDPTSVEGFNSPFRSNYDRIQYSSDQDSSAMYIDSGFCDKLAGLRFVIILEKLEYSFLGFFTI